MIHTIINLFCGASLCILAVFGFTDIIKYIALKTNRSKDIPIYYIVYPLNGSSEHLEYTLRSFASKVQWMNKHRPEKIVCLDLGMDENSKEICELIHKEYDFIEAKTKDDLLNLLTTSVNSNYSNME